LLAEKGTNGVGYDYGWVSEGGAGVGKGQADWGDAEVRVCWLVLLLKTYEVWMVV
jgi:hypothetical protein